jgi:hypothetical protein
MAGGPGPAFGTWNTTNINLFVLIFSTGCVVSGRDFRRTESDSKRTAGFNPCDVETFTAIGPEQRHRMPANILCNHANSKRKNHSSRPHAWQGFIDVL